MNSACKIPHMCSHRGYFPTTHDKYKYCIDLACDTLEECKYGSDFNEIYKTKPTDTQIEELQDYLYVKGQLAEREKEKRRSALFNKYNEEGQLITISIDQEYKQPAKLMGDILNELKSYKFITDYDALACCEVNGENGYNPHIHVAVRKSKAPSSVAQPLRLKFVADKNGVRREKWQCYRVQVETMPYGSASKYCYGEKTSPEKMIACEKDEKWRMENGIKNIYQIN